MQHLRRRARPIHLKARRRWESRSNNHHTPLLSRGGESRRGSGGWGGAGQQNRSLDHPSSRAKVASQLFICRAATPPRLRREFLRNPHSCAKPSATGKKKRWSTEFSEYHRLFRLFMLGITTERNGGRNVKTVCWKPAPCFIGVGDSRVGRVPRISGRSGGDHL